MINYKEIESKWQKAWADSKVFELEPNENPAEMVTAAWAYVEMPLHIGHLRCYGTADLYARFKRMLGVNVLFPMGFHKTGTPILAIAKRVKANDKEIIKILEIYKIRKEIIEKMTDPIFIVDYFSRTGKDDLSAAGFSIDWRREITSTDPIFSKMVDWQFHKLKDQGLLTQGAHPVGWCPNENNAVSQHDTQHDAEPETDKVIAIKFKDADSDACFPCATYRPETLYAVTNIFVNNSKYVLAKINGEHYYLSKQAAELLGYQLSISVERELEASELLSKKVINPLTNETIPVLPGYFVRSDVGTGVVMSVPAHAPFDYVALERLKAKGYSIPAYKSCVSSGETDSGKLPALAYLELINGTIDSDEKLVEQATKELYRHEEKHGVMSMGKYTKMPVSEARPLISKELIGAKSAFDLYIISNEEPVYCRCGSRVVVKVVSDQWFIDYGNAKWKAQVREYLPEMRLYPENARNAFKAYVEWYGPRAAERAQGLGTKFPFNPSHIIEALSDSTIYMMFYTFAHILKANKITPEQLKPEFFEYVIGNSKNLSQVSKATGIVEPILTKCKESFDYWYATTSRHSGSDLVTNHLILYIYNHVAIFNKRFWPKQIVVNGLIEYEGSKMSKSLGNIVPMIDAVNRYGADPSRFVAVASSDLGSAVNFSTEATKSVLSRNQILYDAVVNLKQMSSEALTTIDYWLYSKLNRKIRSATMHMKNLELRDAYIEIYYNSVAEMKWYFTRNGRNALVVKDFLDKVVLMLSPAMPHFTEELWHMLGNSTLVAKERWPVSEQSLINDEIEAIEEMISSTAEDISTAKELTSKMSSNSGKKLSSITIILSEQWKTKAYNLLAERHNIAKVISDELLKSVDKSKLAGFLSQFSKKIQTISKVQEMNEGGLLEAFEQASQYLGKRFDTNVKVELEYNSKSARASKAMPNKPSIDIRWE